MAVVAWSCRQTTDRSWNHIAFQPDWIIRVLARFMRILFNSGRASFHSATDGEALKAAFLLAKMEGIIPALESAHALAILEKIHFRKEENIVICLSGRGDKDMNTYMNYMEENV